MSRSDRFLQKLTSPEAVTFLAVGGIGYVVDVTSFNLLRSGPFLSTVDPSYARIVAVALAMVVTYLGNRLFTWRGQAKGNRRREIGLFITFNIIGLALSVATLVVSHDLLGLTSRLADNISANVIGLGLGTLFRYWSYKTFVFRAPGPAQAAATAVLPALPHRAHEYVGAGPRVGRTDRNLSAASTRGVAARPSGHWRRRVRLYYLRDRVQASITAGTVSSYNHELGVLQDAVLDHDIPRRDSRGSPTTGCDRGRDVPLILVLRHPRCTETRTNFSFPPDMSFSRTMPRPGA
jgi:putative flippase GtrA